MGNLSYTAPPTIARFMQSDAFVRLILGPVGSGKTTGCLLELMRRMVQQEPAQDGIRHTRFAITRQTLLQLKTTVLKEFSVWLEPITHFKVSDSTIFIRFKDIESEVHLIPLDDEKDIRRLLSLQLTAAWCNEFTEVDPNIIPGLCGRLGRYPSAAMGGPTWFGLLGDSNFCSEGSEWWRLMELDTPSDWQIFKQPGGRTAAAENVENLPGGREYYERLSRGQSDTWIKRYVDAQYGPDPSGSAVFRESWKYEFHSVEELTPVLGHPLLIGQDFGLDPAAVICQVDHRGRVLVLDEVASEDMGLQQHLTRGLRPKLMDKRYMGRPVMVVGDPAGRQRSSLSEETSFDLLKRSGFMCTPAPTNDIDSRIRAVEALLLAQAGGGPALLVDRSRCPKLIRALNGGYRYQYLKNGQKKPTPEKNEHSHIADALQYACLAAHGGWMAPSGLITRQLRRPPVGASMGATMPASAWT